MPDNTQMGGCGSVNRKKESHIKSLEDSIYFLEPKQNSIFNLSQSGFLSKIVFGPSEQVPKHSAYTFSSPFLYIIGGSDAEHPLRDDVLKLNTEDLTLEYLSTLPFCAKHGAAYTHCDFLYYIGGVRVQNYSAAPTPFLRLVKDSLCWEVLGDNLQDLKTVNITNSLLMPGSCKVNGVIYLIGGETLKQNGEKTPNEVIFCFDLDTLSISQLEVSGIFVLHPCCFKTNSGILVLGGKIDRNFNTNMWIISERIMKISENNIKVSGLKVMQKIAGCFVVAGNGKIKKLREDRMTWKVEKVKNEKVQSEAEVKVIVNSKRMPEAVSRVTVNALFEELEGSKSNAIRTDSRKLSPSNLFNSQLDFDYSQTFQMMPHKELSELGSILDKSGV
jgi:hypothetical protein